MKKKHLLIALFALVSGSALAQEWVYDVRNHPEGYFLRSDQVASSVTLLPPPPQPGSAQFQYDEAQYTWGKMQRITPRGRMAFEDAKLGGDGLSKTFSEAFGITISKEETPEIYTLIQRMGGDSGDLATREAKNHYMRMRPFLLFGEQSLTPDDEKGLAQNGSYPSGHTANGWATALVLAEINPDRQDEILRRGYEHGQSRVICGVHYQSDVDAGRVVASAVVARLHADKDFMTQLEKAKKEFARLQKAGKVKKHGE